MLNGNGVFFHKICASLAETFVTRMSCYILFLKIAISL